MDLTPLFHGHAHQYNITSEKSYKTRKKNESKNPSTTLHYIGVDSLGSPSNHISFNEIRIECNYENSKTTRKAKIKKVEFKIDEKGEIETIPITEGIALDVETSPQ